eukprot:4046122-Karenia_brevis.AAC.1
MMRMMIIVISTIIMGGLPVCEGLELLVHPEMQSEFNVYLDQAGPWYEYTCSRHDHYHHDDHHHHQAI